MKKKIKILQLIGISIMAVIFVRAGLLDILQVSDFHYLCMWNTLFVISIILICLYPIYTFIVYLKNTDNEVIWKSIVDYFKNIIKWINE